MLSVIVFREMLIESQCDATSHTHSYNCNQNIVMNITEDVEQLNSLYIAGKG